MYNVSNFIPRLIGLVGIGLLDDCSSAGAAARCQVNSCSSRFVYMLSQILARTLSALYEGEMVEWVELAVV